MRGSNARERSFWTGVALIAVGLPTLFWVRYGQLSSLALGLTIFLILLCVAARYLPILNSRFGDDLSTKVIRPKWWDRLGVIWLLAIPFGPFAAWVLKSLATADANNWRPILGAVSVLCVAIPVLTVLPLLRYVRGSGASYALLILFIGTAFPVGAGWSCALDFVQGPKWQQVEIKQLARVHISVRMRDVETSKLEVQLTDGRLLGSDIRVVKLRTGPAQLLVLDSVGEILDARQ